VVVEWPESKPAGWRTGLAAEEREGSPERGVPRRRKPSGKERWWWSRGAAEGASKEVEGALGVGAVSGASEGDRGGGS
jgi:hypothetical protein